MRKSDALGVGIFWTFWAIAAIVVIYVCSTTTLTCNRSETAQNSCRLERKGWGRFGIWDIAIQRLDGAHEDRLLYRKNSSRSTNYDATFRVVLLTEAGPLPMSNWDDKEANERVERIERFVQDPAEVPWLSSTSSRRLGSAT